MIARSPSSRELTGSGRCGRLLLRSAVCAGAAGVLAIGSAGTASAAQDGGHSDGQVEVGSSIMLSALAPDFTLTGHPGATVEGVGAVTFTVETNNRAGYSVTVNRTATMVVVTTGDLGLIPIGALSVRETGTTPYSPVSEDPLEAVTVYTQPTRSAQGGDDLSNDYQVVIPFAHKDTYSATLDYVAASL